MTSEAVADPAVRVTVDLGTFRAWRIAAPWPGEPGRNGPPADVVRQAPEASAPVVVAAAAAVLARGRVAVALRLTAPTVRLAAHLSVADGLAAVMTLARLGPRPADVPDADAWVQIAVLPAAGVVDEVLRWVPLAVPQDPTPRLADGTRLVLTTVGDGAAAPACWQAWDGVWRATDDVGDAGDRGDPGDAEGPDAAAAFGDDLRRRVAAVLNPAAEPVS